MLLRNTIGIAGRARHGKGTMAAILKAWHVKLNLPVQVISFADPLKDFLTLLVGRSEPFRGDNAQRTEPLPELRWADLAEPFQATCKAVFPTQDWSVNPSGRQLMQLFGTDVIRLGFLGDAWIRIAANRANQFLGTTIIDDVRFPNEARPIREHGIFDTVIKVIRPDIPNINHASENAVDEIPMTWFDGIFENHQGVDELDFRVQRWAGQNLLYSSITKGNAA